MLIGHCGANGSHFSTQANSRQNSLGTQLARITSPDNWSARQREHDVVAICFQSKYVHVAIYFTTKTTNSVFKFQRNTPVASLTDC